MCAQYLTAVCGQKQKYTHVTFVLIALHIGALNVFQSNFQIPANKASLYSIIKLVNYMSTTSLT